MGKNDNSIVEARDLGQLNGRRKLKGFVGRRDKLDFYQFTLANRSRFSLSLRGLKDDANLTLMDDVGEAIATSRKKKKKAEKISTDLEAGTYYVRVDIRRGNTRYRLTAAARLDKASPGNEPSAAYQVGNLSDTFTFRDRLVESGDIDYYQFALPSISKVFSADIDH